MVYQREVTIQTDKIDRYGREIGKVIHNGDDVCLEQIKRGMAWWYRDYQREQSPKDRALYEAAEATSKAAGAGLWADKEPVAPWEWRRRGL